MAGSGLLALLLRLDTPYSHIWWTFALLGALRRRRPATPAYAPEQQVAAPRSRLRTR